MEMRVTGVDGIVLAEEGRTVAVDGKAGFGSQLVIGTEEVHVLLTDCGLPA
jgi:hypothetical protein